MASDKPVSSKKLTVIGRDHLSSGGGFLILPNLLRYQDVLRLEKLLEGREIVYLVEHNAPLSAPLKAHLEQEHTHALAIATDLAHADEYRKAVNAEIERGAILIYLPAEAAALNAGLTTVPGAKLDFLLKADVPVVPLYVQPTSAIALPIEGAHDPDEVTMAAGAKLEGEDVTLPAYQEALFVLAERCFSAHPALNTHLAYALIPAMSSSMAKTTGSWASTRSSRRPSPYRRRFRRRHRGGGWE
jgi:acyl-[acyl-carrier-protein]-phospholipid O-acyltransferase / long-chain-fatty-acid--[acyl-carrier-protein] ligase